MGDDLQILEQLNIRIGIEESRGDEEARSWLNGILAPELSFRRADRETFDNRDKFLNKIQPGEPRETEVVSIDLHGDRSIVVCIVTMKDADKEKKFHNLRLFVRHQGRWKLLAWANEPL